MSRDEGVFPAKIDEERALEFIRGKVSDVVSINITGCLTPEFTSMYWFLTPRLKDQLMVWMVTGEVRGKMGGLCTLYG